MRDQVTKVAAVAAAMFLSLGGSIPGVSTAQVFCRNGQCFQAAPQAVGWTWAPPVTLQESRTVATPPEVVSEVTIDDAPTEPPVVAYGSTGSVGRSYTVTYGSAWQMAPVASYGSYGSSVRSYGSYATYGSQGGYGASYGTEVGYGSYGGYGASTVSSYGGPIRNLLTRWAERRARIRAARWGG